MSDIPEGLLYTREHEWIRLEDDCGVVGITDYAQQSLSDIVFVELPEPGTLIKQNEPFGAVDSSKASSELFAPMSGEVVEVNGELEDHPELVNSDPYGRGWMVKIRLSDPAESSGLMDAAAYGRYLNAIEEEEG